MYYRKYRPQTWEGLDNRQIRETLGRAVLSNNWSHAYLLIGSRGTGKTTTARLIAKTVNCLNRKKGEEPCNKCNSCKAITASASLDVIEIDAASNTGVDDIRDLREKVKLAPAASKYKVYIIDEVHMLSTSAFNALLKTLEEPPEHVIFVLATTDPQKLPETIVSRCLVYDFGLAAPEEIKTKLAKIARLEKLDITEEVLVTITGKAAGSHRDAQKILEQLAASGAKANLERLDSLNAPSGQISSQTLLDLLAKHKKAEALREIGRYNKANGKIRDLISALISDLRNIILSGTGDLNENDAKILISKLIEANSMLRDSPIASLPLELVIIEWCSAPEDGKQKTEGRNTDVAVGPADYGLEEIKEKWSEIVAATKSHNHSLHAFLRAAKPKNLEGGGFLIVEVLYKFHKEKLEDARNRDILEGVISDIIGRKVKVKFSLIEKK